MLKGLSPHPQEGKRLSLFRIFVELASFLLQVVTVSSQVSTLALRAKVLQQNQGAGTSGPGWS